MGDSSKPTIAGRLEESATGRRAADQLLRLSH